jgi:uncharacterized repeat protein (TIGR01451 family)
MRSPPVFLPAFLLLLGFSATGWAAGTPAGTSISNQATTSYQVGGSTLTKDSNTSTISVAELIDVSIVSQDGGNVAVAPGTIDQYLTFRVTNTGNGTESFTLVANSLQPGDQFDPTLVGIYLDSNGNGQYDTGIDTVVPAGILSNLAADAAVTIFVVTNIPTTLPDGNTPLADGNTGSTTVTIESNTGAGALGSVIANGGDGSAVDAVIGVAGGLPLPSTAVYTISSISVAVNKTATVIDPFGGSEPIPGATVTYSLAVTVTGSGTAVGMTITDPIPANTTYKPGTLTLAGSGLSDSSGDDAGETTGTPVNQIFVRLGDMPAGAKNVTFAVTIN